MSLETSELVARIHAADTRLVLAASGGAGAIAALCAVPGASRVLLQAVVPYSTAASTEWLGSRPENFCSSRTARAMAMVAYRKGLELAAREGGNAKVAGVACTASLASDRPKRGPHRFFVATQTADTTTCLHVELQKGARSREQEETIVTRAILNEVAQAAGISEPIASGLSVSEQPEREQIVAPIEWQELLAGARKRIGVNTTEQNPRLVFPGAFNPLHVGHRQMAAVAEQIAGVPLAYEISIVNVDKPPLDFVEIANRLKQFEPSRAVWLTRAPTFVEKAAILPGATFVVGADTLERIAEPRYYHENIPAMLRAIEQIALSGCRFLVFGRMLEGSFQGLADLNLPPSLVTLCSEVPEGTFRNDISSTELRRQETSE